MKVQNADIFQKIAMNWTQGEVKHTSNGSKATQTIPEMIGQTKNQVKGHTRKMLTA